MFFEKPSLRTRVSFEVAMTQLGGQRLFAKGDEFSIGTRETPEDAARVLSRYADAIVIRTHAHEPLQRFAAASSVPVINGLSALAHPCQALADLLTLKERFGQLGRTARRIFWATRKTTSPRRSRKPRSCPACTCSSALLRRIVRSETFLAQLKKLGRRAAEAARAFSNAVRAVRGVDAIYTDVWTSMGEEAASERNRAVLAPYRVSEALLRHAAPHAVFMHCLPAHRGEEVTAGVIDGCAKRRLRSGRKPHARTKSDAGRTLTDLKGFPV